MSVSPDNYEDLDEYEDVEGGPWGVGQQMGVAISGPSFGLCVEAEVWWTLLVGVCHVEVSNPHPSLGACRELLLQVTIDLNCLFRGTGLQPVHS